MQQLRGEKENNNKTNSGPNRWLSMERCKMPGTTHPDPHSGRRKPNVAGHPMAHMHAALKHTQDKMWKKNQQGK